MPVCNFTRKTAESIKEGISNRPGTVKNKRGESSLQIRKKSSILVSLSPDELNPFFRRAPRTCGDQMAGTLPGYAQIVEQRIKEAMENGEFDNLPGKGKPLSLEDDSHIPEELRLAYKLLKNADCLPPELLEKKEILQMEDMLAAIPDEKERYKLIKKINFKIMKLNMMGRKSPLLEEKQIYYKKLVDKIAEK